MKSLLLFLSLIATAVAGQLDTPHTVTLNPTVSLARCYAQDATTAPYKTTLTGFSADGNYIEGQVASHFTCGSSGRGGTLHTVTLCTYLTWDLSGVLVNSNTPSNGLKSIACPQAPLIYPPATPPSSTSVGNEFTNSGGTTIETIIAQFCGTESCYATYLYPTLIN